MFQGRIKALPLGLKTPPKRYNRPINLQNYPHKMEIPETLVYWLSFRFRTYPIMFILAALNPQTSVEQLLVLEGEINFKVAGLFIRFYEVRKITFPHVR